MSRQILSAAVVASAMICLCDNASADTLWQTQYTNDGNTFDVRVKLATGGTSGTYDTFDGSGNKVGSGTLSNVKYNSIGGQGVLKGDWRFEGNQSGRFSWAMDAGLDNFNGTWGFGNQGAGGGSWNGSFDSGSGAVGGGGPFKKNN